MKYRLIIRDFAKEHIKEAARWYEQNRRGLGREFVADVDDCMERIRTFPQSYQCVHGNIRRAVTRRFPYKIFYVFEEDAVQIIAVWHHKRDVESLLRRLETQLNEADS